MKLDIEKIEQIANTTISDKQILSDLLVKIKKAAAEEEADKAANKVAKAKNKFLAVQLENTESVYILQAKEDFEEKSLVDIVRTKIAVDFNNSKKGSKTPVTSLSEVFEFVTNKFFKDYDLAIKTREPVDLIKTPNHKIVTK